MTRAVLTFTPRLLPAPEAAAFLGVSVSTLRALPIPRRVLGAKRLYDVIDLNAYASSLPIEGESADADQHGANTCDQVWGITG